MRTRVFALVGVLAVALAVPSLASSAGRPAVGTAAEDVDLSTVPGAIPHEGGWAVPLAGERPSWYTPLVAAQVAAADGQAVAAPLDAPLPSEVGIRPSSWMIEPYGCTMNFVFQKSGALAIGTAGHSVDRWDRTSSC